jgi:hypothetical protein
MSETTAEQAAQAPAIREAAPPPANAKAPPPTGYLDDETKRQWWMAEKLSQAAGIPDAYRKSPSDCYLAIRMAHQIGIEPLAFMQRSYPVKGKIGIEGQLYIGVMNSSGIYKHGIGYKLTGEGMARKCVAYGQRADNDEIESAEVSMQMADKEGWLGKAGSKWQTMPDHMLKLRAGAFLVREYHPELVLGLTPIEEIVDVDGAQVVRRRRTSDLNATLQNVRIKDA